MRGVTTHGYAGTPLAAKLRLRPGLTVYVDGVLGCAVDATWSGLKLVRRLRDR